jgi:hypothetical protein
VTEIRPHMGMSRQSPAHRRCGDTAGCGKEAMRWRGSAIPRRSPHGNTGLYQDANGFTRIWTVRFKFKRMNIPTPANRPDHLESPRLSTANNIGTPHQEGLAQTRSPIVLITGAGRGIGLELVRQYLADGLQPRAHRCQLEAASSHCPWT